MLAFLLGVHEALTEWTTPVLCSLAMTLLGAEHIAAGIWGISFSRAQEREFSGSRVIVYGIYIYP